MKHTKIGLFLILLLTAAMASAGPSAQRTQEGSGLLNQLFGTSKHKQATTEPQPATTTNTPKTVLKQVKPGIYDGVWKDEHGRILLIKQIHRTLYVSGSSNHAAWQAQCVMAHASARCIGNGISNTAGEFSYEGKLQTNRNRLRLQSNWTRSYSSGQTRSAQANLNKQL